MTRMRHGVRFTRSSDGALLKGPLSHGCGGVFAPFAEMKDFGGGGIMELLVRLGKGSCLLLLSGSNLLEVSLSEVESQNKWKVQTC